MRNRDLKKAIAAATFVLLATSESMDAQDASAADAPGAPAAEQVAPPQAVLPQDVPQPVPEQIKPAASELSATDQEFLRNTLEAVTIERELSKLAIDRGETEETKALGRELLGSQARNGAALKELAQARNFSLNLPPGGDQDEILNSLREKSGPEFDGAFQAQLIQDRPKLLQSFGAEAKSAKDPQVRAFALRVLSELKSGRPLATAAATESAQRSRDIARVALSPTSPTKPATAATPPPTAGSETTATSTPDVSTATTGDDSVTSDTVAPRTSATGTAVQSATVNPAPAPQISRSSSQSVEDAQPPIVDSAPSQPTAVAAAASRQTPPATLPSTEAQVQTTRPTPSRPPTISSLSTISQRERTQPVTTETTRAATPSSLESVPPPTTTIVDEPVETRPVRVDPQTARMIGRTTVVEVPEASVQSRIVAPRKSTTVRRIETAPPTIAPPSVAVRPSVVEKRIGAVSKNKKATGVAIQNAPRPRIVRSPEAHAEVETTSVPPPRKAVRRKLFQTSDDDEEDDDNDD